MVEKSVPISELKAVLKNTFSSGLVSQEIRELIDKYSQSTLEDIEEVHRKGFIGTWVNNLRTGKAGILVKESETDGNCWEVYFPPSVITVSIHISNLIIAWDMHPAFTLDGKPFRKS